MPFLGLEDQPRHLGLSTTEEEIDPWGCTADLQSVAEQRMYGGTARSDGRSQQHIV